MKRLVLLACLFVFGLSAVHARADVDPRIGLGDPTCSGDETTIGADGNFSFASNTSGGGFFTFCNHSGQFFNTIDIKFVNTAAITPGSIVCESSVGYHCTVSGTAVIDLLFSLPIPIGGGGGDEGVVNSLEDDENFCTNFGIGNNCVMTINLNDPGLTTGGWGPTPIAFFGQGSSEVANATIPEPASMLLLGSGLLGLWGIRRRRG